MVFCTMVSNKMIEIVDMSLSYDDEAHNGP